MHVSMWDGARNVFETEAPPPSLSPIALNVIGGVIHSADALAAFLNPTVNSYKRINAPRTTSGATWAPNTVTWTGNNRTHMIRVPDSDRFELRLADGAANPYLMPATVLAAGLDGLQNARDPGPRLDVNMYTEGHTVAGAKTLPLNLLDALRALDGSDVLRAALPGLVPAYLKLKMREWDDYARHLTVWERETTLDC